MAFPERVYTEDEVNRARELIAQGHKHTITINGKHYFKRKAQQALEFIKTAGYYDFFRTYIRSIIEIDGLTQLREADAAIWATRYTVENPVDAAGFFVQKASVMEEYLEGKLYYGGTAEKRSVEKRIEFLKSLKEKSDEKGVVAECERLLDLWRESSLVY
jgi:hypothetical protein